MCDCNVVSTEKVDGIWDSTMPLQNNLFFTIDYSHAPDLACQVEFLSEDGESKGIFYASLGGLKEMRTCINKAIKAIEKK